MYTIELLYIQNYIKKKNDSTMFYVIITRTYANLFMYKYVSTVVLYVYTYMTLYDGQTRCNIRKVNVLHGG